MIFLFTDGSHSFHLHFLRKSLITSENTQKIHTGHYIPKQIMENISKREERDKHNLIKKKNLNRALRDLENYSWNHRTLLFSSLYAFASVRLNRPLKQLNPTWHLHRGHVKPRLLNQKHNFRSTIYKFVDG